MAMPGSSRPIIRNPHQTLSLKRVSDWAFLVEQRFKEVLGKNDEHTRLHSIDASSTWELTYFKFGSFLLT